MADIIEKTLLAGIGTLALSQKKVEELIQDLKSRMNLREEKGQELLSSLREAARTQQQKLEEAAQKEVQRMSGKMGLISREEFEALEKRVKLLESRLQDKA